MQGICEQLKSAGHIWIYGAGIVGKRALKTLSNKLFNLSISGIVISKHYGQEDEVNGYKIVEIKELISEDKDNTVFIIAVSEKYQEEIVDTLRTYGYEKYIIWSDREFATRQWLLAEYTFENRRRGMPKACFILSGYKEFLWDNVFKRLKRFVPEDIDVCILSSGLKSDKLSQTAKENGWSYLNTKVNDITLIQNIAMLLFEQADWIYKMDEDIFLTRNCFDKLLQFYGQVEEQEPYRVGFIAPLIPINGYGYIRLLDYLKKRKLYEETFEKVLYGGNSESMIEKSIDVAEFMWGATEDIPQLDELNAMLMDNSTYSVCGVRFSIGFILFHRAIWEEMGGFSVSGNIDLGIDEIELCQHCMIYSKAIIVAENTVVGHFSFGQQTKMMCEFYKKNPELFYIREEN